MCGILGIKYKNKSIKNKDKHLFLSALNLIRDRGLNKHVYNFDAKSIYGYVRLPTDGINTNVEKSIRNEGFPLLLYNGIINNLQEMRKLFFYKESSNLTSDHHLLRKGFQQYGISFLEKIKGMFAFAYISETEIILVRDTIGIKPLYYFYDKTSFAFASEIKALMVYQPKFITEVKPGEVITFNKETFKVSKKTFSYHSQKNKISLEKILYNALIVPTKRYFLQSKKPIGVLLSGGLDSSIVCAMFYKYLTRFEIRRLKCFCVGIPDASDVSFSKQVAKKYNLHLELAYPESNERCIKDLRKIIYKVESPYSRVVKVAFLQVKLAQVVKKAGIDVVVSGEGADELFYGYRKFIDGLTPKQINLTYDRFFKDIFYRTLLQRLDRTFAKNCIEARVPFLDQALVFYAKSLTFKQKIITGRNGLQTKVLLRKLAKRIGLPEEIIYRQKTTMTLGATLQENKEDDDGYLELFFKKKTKKQPSSIIKKIYLEYFGRNGKDILSNGKINLRKEELSRVSNFRHVNSVKTKILL